MCIILGLLAAMVLRYSIKTFSEVTFVDSCQHLFCTLLIYLGDSTYMRTCAHVCVCVTVVEFYLISEKVRVIIASLDR